MHCDRCSDVTVTWLPKEEAEDARAGAAGALPSPNPPPLPVRRASRAAAAASRLARCGTSRCPSWPSRLEPNVHTLPSLVTATEWCVPAAAWVTVALRSGPSMRRGVATKPASTPDPMLLAEVAEADEDAASEAAMEAKAAAAPGASPGSPASGLQPHAPVRLSPHAKSSPAVLTARQCFAPTEMDATKTRVRGPKDGCSTGITTATDDDDDAGAVADAPLPVAGGKPRRWPDVAPHMSSSPEDSSTALVERDAASDATWEATRSGADADAAAVAAAVVLAAPARVQIAAAASSTS